MPVPAVAPLGMTNWQANAPAVVVVIVEPVNVQVPFDVPLGVMVIPSKVSVTLEPVVLVAPKPVPRAVTVEPIRPLDGPTVTLQAVTVYEAEADCAGYVVSLAINVPAPAVAPLGMTNWQANAPAVVVVIVEPVNVQVPFDVPLG
ncbi:MAG: hypothetical protein WB984_04485, partial [Thermoplasmata archaeon]